MDGRIGDHDNGKSAYNSATSADKFSSASETIADNDVIIPPGISFEPVPEEDKCRLEALKLYEDEKGLSWPIQVCTLYPFEKFEISPEVSISYFELFGINNVNNETTDSDMKLFDIKKDGPRYLFILFNGLHPLNDPIFKLDCPRSCEAFEVLSRNAVDYFYTLTELPSLAIEEVNAAFRRMEENVKSQLRDIIYRYEWPRIPQDLLNHFKN